MAIAYVLISTAPVTMTREVLAVLKQRKEIVETMELFGEYDIIAKIEDTSYSDVGNRVREIQQIDGVIDTHTLTVLRF